MATVDARPDKFPASYRRTSGPVNGVETEITLTNFSDRILVTISQGGRLSQWVSDDINPRWHKSDLTSCYTDSGSFNRLCRQSSRNVVAGGQ